MNKSVGTKVSFRDIFKIYDIRRFMVFPVMALVFIAIIIVYHTLLMSYARKSIQESGEVNAGRAATEIELYLSSGMETLEEAAYALDRMMIEHAPEGEDLEYLTNETEILQNTTFVNTTGLYAYMHGVYHDGSGWDPGPDYDATERPWYKEAIANQGEIVLVDPYLDLYSGDVVMTIAKSLSDGKSVVAIDVTLGRMQDIIEKHSNEYSNTVNMVISKNGLVVAHTAQSEVGKNYHEDLESLGSVAFFMAGKNPETGFDFEYDNRSYTACAVQISNGWYCLSVADSQTIYAPVKRMVIMSVLAIMLTVLAFAFIMYRAGKRDLESRHLELLLKSSADIYMSLCEFDMESDSVIEIKNVNPAISNAVKMVDHNASEIFKNVMNLLPDSPTKQLAVDFTDLTTIDERLKDKDTATVEYYSFGGKWVRARLIVSERTKEGKVARVLWMLEDITSEKEERDSLVDMSERAVAASEAKSAFLSNMSHEIRTPINAVLGMNEMILRESEDEHIISYANTIRSAGNSLLALINDILDFSKIESGKMEIVPVEYDFGEFINDLVNITKVRMEEKGLELKLDIDPDIPRKLFGDEVRIKQIVTNIMSNAAKYTEKGSVTLKVVLDKMASDKEYAAIVFYVKDTGIGIRKEDISKLFTEFERIDVKKNRNIEGTGLGMAISKRLLEMMGSTLYVESEYGRGSEFSFAIGQGIRDAEPIGDFNVVADTLAKKRENYVPQFTAPDARVLMVDDLMVNLVVFKELLKKTKIMIDTANSGQAALELTRENKYDMLFLDHMMPEMDGIETLEAIRADEGNLNVDTISVCLTANAVTGAKEFYMENGFNDYLTKPINSEQLERMIYEYLPDELIDT